MKPILDVKTRWNSSLYMIERFLKLASILSQVLLELNGTDIPEMISVLELHCLKDICDLLRPFEQLTRELSSEKTVMSSKVFPLILCTRNELQKKNSNVTIAKNLKIKLIEELDFRFRSYEQGPILPICTILDPRFKDMHFKNPLVNSQIQDKLINLMDGIIDNDDIVNHIVPVESVVGSNDGQYDLWSLHKSLE